MTSCAVFELRSPERPEREGRSLREGQGSGGRKLKEVVRFVTVRDYKDRAILRSLQLCARSENPGFVWFDEQKERAKLAWLRRDRYGDPVGYCIFRESRYEYSAHAGREVCVPRYVSQIFVSSEQRRRSIASGMIRDFVTEGGRGPLWVESPKRETIALLHGLGYRESRERYQLWEMMFGLTCWARHGQADGVILPVSQGGSAEYCEPWLWSGDGAIEMASLR